MKYATTGIDIGTETLRIGIIEHDTKEHTEHVVGFYKYPLSGLRKGHIGNEQLFKASFRKAVKDIENQLHFKIDSVNASIGSASLACANFSANSIVSKIDGEVTRYDIENLEKTLDDTAVQKSKKIIYSQIIEYKVDGKVVLDNPEGLRGVKIEIKKLYIYVLALQYDILETILFENDIELAHLFPKGIHAGTAVLSEKQKVVGVGFLDIGAETTSLTVYENNVVVGYTLIPIGSNDVTNDIALVLKISLDEAEAVKTGQSTQYYQKKKVDDIVNSRIEDICELVNSYLRKIRRSELLPGGIVVTGGGSQSLGLEEQLRKSLNLPVKKATFEISTMKKGTVRQSEFLECYGLAVVHTEDEKSGPGKHGTLLEKIKKNSSTFLKQFLP